MGVQCMEYPRWVLQSIQCGWHGPTSGVSPGQLLPAELALLSLWMSVVANRTIHVRCTVNMHGRINKNYKHVLYLYKVNFLFLYSFHKGRQSATVTHRCTVAASTIEN